MDKLITSHCSTVRPPKRRPRLNMRVNLQGPHTLSDGLSQSLVGVLCLRCDVTKLTGFKWMATGRDKGLRPASKWRRRKLPRLRFKPFTGDPNLRADFPNGSPSRFFRNLCLAPFSAARSHVFTLSGIFLNVIRGGLTTYLEDL